MEIDVSNTILLLLLLKKEGAVYGVNDEYRWRRWDY